MPTAPRPSASTPSSSTPRCSRGAPGRGSSRRLSEEAAVHGRRVGLPALATRRASASSKYPCPLSRKSRAASSTSPSQGEPRSSMKASRATATTRSPTAPSMSRSRPARRHPRSRRRIRRDRTALRDAADCERHREDRRILARDRARTVSRRSHRSRRERGTTDHDRRRTPPSGSLNACPRALVGDSHAGRRWGGRERQPPQRLDPVC
jgi:hypothetical protein